MGRVTNVESEDEFNDVLESAGGSIVVADFWATWCGPCKMIGPAFERMAEEAEFKSLVFIKVDVDEAGDLAEEWQIQCMPTFVVIKNKEKIDEISGASKDELRKLLMKYKS